MHELSLAQSMLDLVADSAAREGITRVRRVTLLIGEWSAVQPDTLTTCFAMLVAEAGAPLAGAELVINRQPALGECTACGQTFSAEASGLLCPDCGAGARLIAGTELAVDSYEGD